MWPRYEAGLKSMFSCRQGRTDTKLVVNTTGVFLRGVNLFELVDPSTGEVIFSTASPELNLPNGAKNLQAKVRLLYFLQKNLITA